jgi:hypothetical protein
MGSMRDRMVWRHYDVKAVEDVQSLGAVFTAQLQIGFPHVGTDEYDLGNYVLAHSGEESLEGFDGSLFAYPKKAVTPRSIW